MPKKALQAIISKMDDKLWQGPPKVIFEQMSDKAQGWQSNPQGGKAAPKSFVHGRGQGGGINAGKNSHTDELSAQIDKYGLEEVIEALESAYKPGRNYEDDYPIGSRYSVDQKREQLRNQVEGYDDNSLQEFPEHLLDNVYEDWSNKDSSLSLKDKRDAILRKRRMTPNELNAQIKKYGPKVIDTLYSLDFMVPGGGELDVESYIDELPGKSNISPEMLRGRYGKKRAPSPSPSRAPQSKAPFQGPPKVIFEQMSDKVQDWRSEPQGGEVAPVAPVPHGRGQGGGVNGSPSLKKQQEMTTSMQGINSITHPGLADYPYSKSNLLENMYDMNGEDYRGKQDLTVDELNNIMEDFLKQDAAPSDEEIIQDLSNRKGFDSSKLGEILEKYGPDGLDFVYSTSGYDPNAGRGDAYWDEFKKVYGDQSYRDEHQRRKVPEPTQGPLNEIFMEPDPSDSPAEDQLKRDQYMDDMRQMQRDYGGQIPPRIKILMETGGYSYDELRGKSSAEIDEIFLGAQQNINRRQ